MVCDVYEFVFSYIHVTFNIGYFPANKCFKQNTQGNIRIIYVIYRTKSANQMSRNDREFVSNAALLTTISVSTELIKFFIS